MPLAVLGLVMMVDGALTALAISARLSTFWDRSIVDQSLVLGHVVVGLWLFVGGRMLWTPAPPGFRPQKLALAASLLLAAGETTRFDWPWTALRAVYVAAAIAALQFLPAARTMRR